MARAKIKYTGDSPEKVLKKLAAAAPAAMADAVNEWHREIMPGHIETSAVAKYRYQPRKKKYMIRKARQEGHQRPLVFTGQSYRDARAGIRISTRRPRGDAGGLIQARGAMNVPKYFYQYNKSHNAPDKANELTRTIPAEDARLAGTVERRMAERAIKVAGGASEVKTVTG